MAQSTLRVLYFDDEVIDLERVRRMLRKVEGIEVETFSNVQEGLERLAIVPFDCILLDYRIPGVDTIELLGELVRRELPVVMLTGERGSDDLVYSTFEAGVQDFITKGELTPELLSRSIRFGIERYRRLRAEKSLQVANLVQQNLLPKSGPELSGFDIAGLSEMAIEAGGDYFDYFTRPNGDCVIVVGDATGHDLGSAVIMVQLQSYLDAFLQDDTTLWEAMSRSEERLGRRLSQYVGFRFVTSFALQLNPESRSFDYRGFGHESFLLRADGETVTLGSTDRPIGMSLNRSGDRMRPDPVPMRPGDLLFIPTDGLFEPANTRGEVFSKERMLQFVREHRSLAANEILARLFAEVREHFAGLPQSDDMTAVVVKEISGE